MGQGPRERGGRAQCGGDAQRQKRKMIQGEAEFREKDGEEETGRLRQGRVKTQRKTEKQQPIRDPDIVEESDPERRGQRPR